MDIFKIGVTGIIAVILVLTIKNQSQHMALLISITTGVVMFLMIFPALEQVIEGTFSIIKRLDVSIGYVGVILKIIGIAYIAEFCTQICQDAGENAIATKIELAGKVFIIIISIPIMNELLDLITNLIP